MNRNIIINNIWWKIQQPILCLTFLPSEFVVVLMTFFDRVFVRFDVIVFVTFVDTLSVTFIISSYTITENLAILFKYLSFSEIDVLVFPL